MSASGKIFNRIIDNIFGQVTSETNTDFDFRFGYTSRERDEVTGLMYYRARYYDPAVGRFLSEDPLGFDAGDANFYRYVFNSPTNYTDPSGEIAVVPECAGFDEKYKKYTLTLVSEIWRWKKTETSYQYILKSEDNVQDIAIQIVHDFWEDALKYYESYATLSQVDSELNNDPSGECIHQIMDFARCSRGIIAAKLCNRHNYEKLVQIYRERMLNQDKGFYLSSFDCIVNLLSC